MSEEKQSLQEFKERVIALIDAEIDKLKDVPPVTVYEEGKWYKSDNALLIYSKNETRCTGFYMGKWATKFWNINEKDTQFVPATREDIKAALVKEAEKRGFKALSKITRSFYLSGHPTGIPYYSNPQCNYYFESDELDLNGIFLYKGGVWAEMVKEQPLMIGGKEVVYKSFPNGGCCIIDNHKYDYRDIVSLCTFMKDHSSQVKSLNVGCEGQYKVTLEMLEQIIKGFK